MKTDELITVLSQSPSPKKPLCFLLFFPAFFVLTACVTYVTLGFRLEVVQMIPPLGFWIKSLILFSFAALALVSLRQESRPLARKVPVYAFGLLMLGLLVLVGWEWRTTPAEYILDKAYLPNLLFCLSFTSLYAFAGTAAIIHLLKYYAPMHLRKASGLAALAAVATGGLGYSLHCNVDSPTFIAVAYGLPCLVSVLIARKIVPHYINW